MGILVSLSGLDGSGKTTQGKKIMELCLNNGIKAHYIHLKTIDTKESCFNVIAEAKQYAKENRINVKIDREELRNIISAFLFIDKVKKEVTPALLDYDAVIVDRYLDSALCYHMLENGDYDSVVKIYEQVTRPDVNIFLNLSVDECCERVSKRKETTKYENKGSFLKAYDFYASRRDNFLWIEANCDRNVIANKIFGHIKQQIRKDIQND